MLFYLKLMHRIILLLKSEVKRMSKKLTIFHLHFENV